MDVVAPVQAPSPGPNGVTTPPFVTIEPARVVGHLATLLEAALGATREELEDVGSLLSQASYADTLSRCSRFTGDSQALYIQKSLAPTTQLENDAPENRMLASRTFLLLTSPTRWLLFSKLNLSC